MEIKTQTDVFCNVSREHSPIARLESVSPLALDSPNIIMGTPLINFVYLDAQSSFMPTTIRCCVESLRTARLATMLMTSLRNVSLFAPTLRKPLGKQPLEGV